MPVPKMVDLYHPFMLCVEKNKETNLNALVDYMVSYFGLSEEEKNEKIPSGKETKLKNRVGWARKYLRDTGLVSAPERGIVKITQNGQTALDSNHGTIDKKFIESISEIEKVGTSHHETNMTEEIITENKHPEKQNLTGIYENEKDTSTRRTFNQSLLDKVPPFNPEWSEESLQKWLDTVKSLTE